MFQTSLDLTGEVPITIMRGNGEFLARAPFGYDPIDATVWSVFVALSPLPGYADVPGYELVFNILCAATDGSTVREFWDGRDTKIAFDERPIREQVRHLICRCVELLIDEASPNLVSMTTHSDGLPIEALTKFSEICAVFYGKGFRAGKSDVWHGRHIWMMERL